MIRPGFHLSRRQVLAGVAGGAVLAALGEGPHMAWAAGAPRRAFVCGNSAYDRIPVLPNPRGDARAIGGSLIASGFDLHDGTVNLDVAQDALRKGVDGFASGLPADSVALFYFAGHGFQIGSSNYLTGIDAPDDPGGDVDRTYVPLQHIFDALNASRAALNIVVLDACRDNPFAGVVKEAGLAQVDAPTRTLISYSTQPGNVALDGAGGRSPYAAALAKAMAAPGATVLEVFNDTGLAVEGVTKGRQVPWVSLSPIPSRLAFAEALTPVQPVETCPGTPAEMSAPIAALFDGWARLDIRRYEAAWARDAFQIAGKIQRRHGEIIAARRKLMGRLKKVDVLRTAPVFIAREGDVAFFGNTYTMHFHLKNGRVIRETGVQEAYTVACRDGRWLIKENFDYVDRSAAAAKAARKSRGG